MPFWRRKPENTESEERSSIGQADTARERFSQRFAILVFISGLSLGVMGAVIEKTERRVTLEDGKVVQEEQITIQGDPFIQQVGFAMSGLAAGSVFFNYAPGFIEGGLKILAGAMQGASSALQKNSGDEED